jgi:hypothetical protein
MGKTFPEVFIDDVIFGGILNTAFSMSSWTVRQQQMAANKGSSQVEVNTGPFFF